MSGSDKWLHPAAEFLQTEISFRETCKFLVQIIDNPQFQESFAKLPHIKKDAEAILSNLKQLLSEVIENSQDLEKRYSELMIAILDEKPALERKPLLTAFETSLAQTYKTFEKAGLATALFSALIHSAPKSDLGKILKQAIGSQLEIQSGSIQADCLSFESWKIGFPRTNAVTEIVDSSIQQVQQTTALLARQQLDFFLKAIGQRAGKYPLLWQDLSKKLGSTDQMPEDFIAEVHKAFEAYQSDDLRAQIVCGNIIGDLEVELKMRAEKASQEALDLSTARQNILTSSKAFTQKYNNALPAQDFDKQKTKDLAVQLCQVLDVKARDQDSAYASSTASSSSQLSESGSSRDVSLSSNTSTTTTSTSAPPKAVVYSSSNKMKAEDRQASPTPSDPGTQESVGPDGRRRWESNV